MKSVFDPQVRKAWDRAIAKAEQEGKLKKEMAKRKLAKEQKENRNKK